MWGVPVDHETFEHVSSSQWLWYYYNFVEDNKEEFESERDLVEYSASFIEPEAVRKIRDSREKAISVSEDQFAEGINTIFGRPLNLNAATNEEKKVHKADVSQILNNYNKIKQSNDVPTTVNFKDWSNFKLG